MPFDATPAMQSVYVLLLWLAVFFAVTAIALRLGCRFANGIGGWSGRFAPLTMISWGDCFRIVLLPVFVLSLIGGAEASSIATLSRYADERVVRIAASILEWFAFGALVAWGLSNLQPVRNRLILLATAIQIALVVAVGYGLAQLAAAIVR